MTIHSYLLFVAASIVLALIPGPDMAFMLGRCIAQGRRAGVLSALGFNTGSYVYLTGAVLGLSAVLAASPVAFTSVRWLGALYLAYLGVRSLVRTQKGLETDSQAPNVRPGASVFWQAFMTDILNPKVMIFFVAFLPQFVDQHGAHPTLQLLLLGVTVNMVCLATNLVLVNCSARLTETLRSNARFDAWLQRGLGALFIGIGLRLATQEM